MMVRPFLMIDSNGTLRADPSTDRAAVPVEFTLPLLVRFSIS